MHHPRPLMVAAALFAAALWVACGGGGGMAETPAESIEGGGAPAPEARPDSHRPAPSPAEPVHEDAEYRSEFADAVRVGWSAPNRDMSMPPRIGVALIQLGPDGTVASWRWRRRSADGPFNDSVERFLERQVGNRRIALPPNGTPAHFEVTTDGIPVEFADPDA